MATVGVVKKHAFEKLDRAIDFSLRLAAGETITLDSCKAYDTRTDVDVSALLLAASPAPQVSGAKVNFRLTAGEVDVIYNVKVKVTTNSGQAKEDDIDVWVVE